MRSVPVWHDDRMVIIGDAAHATSPSAGQGASMALEHPEQGVQRLLAPGDVDEHLLQLAGVGLRAALD